MRRIGLALSLALLVACSSLPVQQPGGPWRAEFELTGRVAVRYGKEGASCRIHWRHGTDADDVLITSPIGQGIATIGRRGSDVRLVTADQKEYEARDAEALTQQVLGWRLPLRGLADWVQGRADPDLPAQVERDVESRIASLRQDDWRVEYQEYDGARPSKLKLSRPDIEIRLVVDEWETPQ